MSYSLRSTDQYSSRNKSADGAQMLLQRMDQLEATVRELRAALAQATAAIPRSTPAEAAPLSQPEPEPQVERAASEGMDLNQTLLRIRGFSDVTLHGSNLKGDTTSFSLGQVASLSLQTSRKSSSSSVRLFSKRGGTIRLAWMSSACCSLIHSVIS